VSTIPSLNPVSYKAKTFLDHKTTSAHRRTTPRLSREVKAKALCANSEATVASLASTTLLGSTKPATCEANTKAPMRANSIADSDSLPLTAPSVKNFCREARDKASPSANNEAILTSLEEKALHGQAKFASKGKTKAVASPCEATLSGEVILASPITRKKALKARPKASRPKMVNIKSP